MGKDIPAILQTNANASGTCDDHVELRWPLPDRICSTKSFLCSGRVRSGPGTRKLIPAGIRPDCNVFRESLVGSRENGCVTFQGVQDQDILFGQINLSCTSARTEC